MHTMFEIFHSHRKNLIIQLTIIFTQANKSHSLGCKWSSSSLSSVNSSNLAHDEPNVMQFVGKCILRRPEE